MNKQQFLAQRRPVWQEFNKLIRRLDQQSWKRLKPDELSRFSRLFRETCFDLALIRSRDWGEGVAEFLNGLVIRGHDCFHQAPPSRLDQVWKFLTGGFPRLMRENIWYFVAAIGLFFVPLGISWAVIQYDPQLAELVLDANTREQMENMYSGSLTPEGWDSFGEKRSLMAGFYVNHNVGIAWQCFAHGILLGIGTVYVLLSNGIVLGAVSGFLVSAGHGDRFLSFAISHGSFELTAIAVAGAGGLMMADAILRPGRRTRIESLRVRGADALKIAAGAGVMLVIAALIEAYWSPSPLPSSVKYPVGAGLWLLVILYFTFAGRDWSSFAAGDDA